MSLLVSCELWPLHVGSVGYAFAKHAVRRLQGDGYSVAMPKPARRCERTLSELGAELANGAKGMSDIEGKVARVVTNECGQ